MSGGLPSYSNYDDRSGVGHEKSSTNSQLGNEKQSTSSQGGLSGLASSIIGASGAAGALESLGIANQSSGGDAKSKGGAYGDNSHSDSNPSSSHLLGSNAYPKSAVDAYSSSSENTSFDKMSMMLCMVMVVNQPDMLTTNRHRNHLIIFLNRALVQNRRLVLIPHLRAKQVLVNLLVGVPLLLLVQLVMVNTIRCQEICKMVAQ